MNQHDASRPESSEPASPHRKKPYRSPELIEWGTLRDITQGTKSGFKDFPAKGGSTGV